MAGPCFATGGGAEGEQGMGQQGGCWVTLIPQPEVGRGHISDRGAVASPGSVGFPLVM